MEDTPLPFSSFLSLSLEQGRLRFRLADVIDALSNTKALLVEQQSRRGCTGRTFRAIYRNGKGEIVVGASFVGD